MPLPGLTRTKLTKRYVQKASEKDRINNQIKKKNIDLGNQQSPDHVINGC